MPLVIRRRTFFVGCTLAFLVAAGMMLAHRSDEPVVVGRYSAAIVAAMALLAVAYGAIAYLYFFGWRRFGRAYMLIASNLLAVLLLLLAINVAAHLTTYFTGSAITAPSDTETVDAQARVHADLIGLSPEEFRAFRSEQGRPQNWVYEPWVGFRETPRTGRYINVSTDGFRHTKGSPTEPDHWVFLLGGSTTFGYGVADDQTIASFLQERLTGIFGEKTFGVRNFGRAYYFSSQEYVLLWTLLRRGAKPSMVIFLDGANELQEEPYYANEMREMFSRYQDESVGDAPIGRLLADLAVQAPVYPYLQRLGGTSSRMEGAERIRPDAPAGEIAAQYEAANTMIRVICERYGVEPFFVVQPIPGYRNTFGTHVFLPEPLPPNILKVLALMEASTANQPRRVNLAGLLESYRKQAFVDQMHYTPEVHRMIADAIAERIAPALSEMAGGGRVAGSNGSAQGGTGR